LDTKIKICGITRVADAQAAVTAGADALGLNFSPISPRRVDVSTAADISAAVGRTVTRVALFVDQDRAEIEEILASVTVDLLQFHGSETGEFCRSFSLPYMKVFRVAAPFDAAAAVVAYPEACALLLDAYVPGVPGGTGKQLALEHWPQTSSVPLILAGGLTAGNVAAAIVAVAPVAVDVCGGVEGATKGIKDHHKMSNFVAAVTAAGSINQ
jgi:phosphoribosylanthranilate isomerase